MLLKYSFCQFEAYISTFVFCLCLNPVKSLWKEIEVCKGQIIRTCHAKAWFACERVITKAAAILLWQYYHKQSIVATGCLQHLCNTEWLF